MSPRWRRTLAEKAAETLMRAAMLLVLACLALILGTVIVKGLPALDWAMLTQTPKGGFYLGREGGILNAIAGSLLLAGGATLLALAAGLPVALYLNVYRSRNSRLARLARAALDMLWGVPSIVYGAFGFALMLFLGLKASLLGGIVTVALLILPVMIRAMDEVLRVVPPELLDASYSVGATRLETALKVVARQALPGLLAAVLLAFGRGVGDAASVLFTAGFTDRIPHSLADPVATLPLAIFFQLGTPFPEVRERAFASALILTALILLISGTTRLLARRFDRHVIR